jgi:diguanylate cyclase (GGDEF)-like protein/PAS domain S-box-containing protein
MAGEAASVNDNPVQPEKDYTDNSISFVIIVVLALGLITWLYIKSEVIAPEVHIQYTKKLRYLSEADAKADAELLAARTGLSLNYDTLNFYVKELSYDIENKLTPPEYLLIDDRILIEQQQQRLIKTLQEKAQLIDRFKRDHTLLQNSMVYFRETAAEISKKNLTQEMGQLFNGYVRNIIFYAQSPESDYHSRQQLNKQKLTETIIDNDHYPKLSNLFLHGDIIEQYTLKTERQLRIILALPSSTMLETLNQLYVTGFANTQKFAERYQTALYVVAILLIMYLSYTFYHLIITRYALVGAHKEVMKRYLAQQRAEKLLLFHDVAFQKAHEGISITDKTGNIIDVNPSFTRITGYERLEAIGQNPRILKSGIHDDDFYKAMWQKIIKTGNWRGEIWNRNKFGEVYPEILSISAVTDANNVITNYVAVFTDISRIKKQEKMLKQLAYHDALTNLPNRTLLLDRLNQAIMQSQRDDHYLAVCYLDLDGFKPINDTYGHEAGDELLVAMAERLMEYKRSADTIARLGGDEFVILLLGLENESEYEHIMQRILNIINQPFVIAQEQVKVSASIGISIYPDDDSDADTLLRHADQAMYQAKQEGKNRIHLFDKKKDIEVRTQHAYLAQIATGFNNGEMALYYQPKVNMQTGEVAGMEALIRWEHPEQGVIPPGKFLPVIEEDDLIIEIGDWVFNSALEQMELWLNEGLELSVNINVAGRHLQHPDFISSLKTALANYPAIKPANIQLEVVETVALENIADISLMIQECKEIGISVALDDFGTGYSSLTYLKRLPVDTLKIDLSFVLDMLNNPDDLAIVHGVIGLSSAFQRNTVAEGVETVEHGRLLIQLGCVYAQGYGIAKPMKAEKVSGWIEDWQADPSWTELKDLYWDDSDFPILAAQVEHSRWVTLLLRAVKSGSPSYLQQISDHTCCNFGHWYYERGKQRYAHLASFRLIESPHKSLHQVAAQIELHLTNNELEEAEMLSHELINNHHEIMTLLKVLSKEVSILIE